MATAAIPTDGRSSTTVSTPSVAPSGPPVATRHRADAPVIGGAR